MQEGGYSINCNRTIGVKKFADSVCGIGGLCLSHLYVWQTRVRSITATRTKCTMRVNRHQPGQLGGTINPPCPHHCPSYVHGKLRVASAHHGLPQGLLTRLILVEVE